MLILIITLNYIIKKRMSYYKCAGEKPSCKGLKQGIKGYHACAKLKKCKKKDITQRNLNKSVSTLLKGIKDVKLKKVHVPVKKLKFNPDTIRQDDYILAGALNSYFHNNAGSVVGKIKGLTGGDGWTYTSANSYINSQKKKYSNPQDIDLYIADRIKSGQQFKKDFKKGKSSNSQTIEKKITQKVSEVCT